MTTHPERRDARGEATRAALLAAARSAFADHGYHAASVRDIASLASVHPALVTYHFGSKEGLWRQVLAESLTGLGQRLAAAYLSSSDDTTRRRAVLGAYLDHLDDKPDFPRLIVRGLLDGDSTVAGLLQRALQPLVAQAGGEVPHGAADSPQDLAVSLFGAAVAPYIWFAPLTAVFGEDPRNPGPATRRREHLYALLDAASGTPR